MRVTCPDDDVLGQLVSGTLEPSRRAEVANHAAACVSCRTLVDALVGATTDRSTPAETTATTDAPARRAPAPIIVEVDPDQPSQVGRYVLERRIGAGGMGVVWAARDPELGRRVAVKLLRRGSGAERLRREAMALARLSHPNVVSVYDVGTHDGVTFVAMALVDGQNLREWLRTPRSQATILDTLVHAGRGVIAAHDAGLVHRDLKPDNIFIGPGGEVLVGDFGLAREPTSSDGGDGAAELAAADTGLTITGAVVGTPAYMAPEQSDGEAVLASDQFAFCVTAWEALHGQRPFEGGSAQALRDAIAGGRIADPPPDHPVTARVGRALRRGLSVDPAARFPSMRALLAALAPPRRRWPFVLTAVAVAAALVAALVVMRRPVVAAAPCDGTESLLATTWSPARRPAIERALTDAGASPASVISALASIDRYAGAWIDLRRSACVATQVRRERGLESLERIALCLDRRAATMGSALDAIARGGLDPSSASILLDELDPIEPCRDPGGTAHGAAPSGDAEALRRELAALDLRNRTIDRGLKGVDVTAMTARATVAGDAVATIAALTLEGQVAMVRARPADAEAALRRAVSQADTAGDDLGRARAAALLVEVLVRMVRLDEALAQLDVAGAALARAGGDPAVAIDVDQARAVLATARGDLGGAVAARHATVDRLRGSHGDDSLILAVAYHALGLAHHEAGEADAARSAFAAGDAIQARFLDRQPGDDAVEAALTHANAALFDGDFARLVDETEQAVALAHLHGPGTVTEAAVIGQLAQAYELAGDQAAAARTYTAAVDAAEVLAARFGDRGVVLDWMIGAGDCHLGTRKPELALTWYRRALARAAEIGAGTEAAAQLARNGVARTLVALGRYQEALPLLRTALDATEREIPLRPFAVAALSFALARALWETGGARDRGRAHSLTSDAESSLRITVAKVKASPMQAGMAGRVEDELARVVAWRAAHP